MMDQINGAILQLHPLRGLKKHTDLISYQGPLLSLFENAEGEPYLYLWCDVDDTANRWIVFRASQERLSRYLGKEISLRDLVVEPADGFVYVVDLTDDLEYRTVWLTAPAALPPDYLPSEDSFLAVPPSHDAVDLVALAQRFGTPLLDLHLIKGRGVKHGASDVITLGTLLANTGELAEDLAGSLFTSRERGDKRSREDARAFGRLEYVTAKAASFSAILRPALHQQSLPGFGDRTGQVVEGMLQLLTGAQSYEGLREASAKYSDTVIRSLEQLLNQVTEFGADIELRWAEPESQTARTARVDQKTSASILAHINQLEKEESAGLWVDGSFIALNIKSRRYRFRAGSGRESSGRFDARLEFPLTRLTFANEYRIQMTRRTITLGGRSKRKVAEVISQIEQLRPTELPLDT